MISQSRVKVSFLVGLWLTGLTLAAIAAQAPVQIHPTPPPEPVERPIVVAVLADGFTAGEQDLFNEAAENFFKYGLLADPHFQSKQDLLTIRTIFNAVTKTSESQFGFVLGTGKSNCSIYWNEDPGPKNTTALIEDAAAPANPSPRMVVVIGNHDYNFGCSDETWMYVAIGAVGEQVLHHEFGHLLGGLKDEYALAKLSRTSYPGTFDDVNCSTMMPPRAQPHWSIPPSNPPFANPPGCLLYGVGIVHPEESCRMGFHGNAFCRVCTTEMNKTWDYYSNPDNLNPDSASARRVTPRILTAAFLQPGAPPTRPSVTRLLVNVDRVKGVVEVLKATSVAGRVVPSRRRNGEYVYEITENGKTLDFGIVPGDPYGAHGYRGGAGQHTRVPEEDPARSTTASIVVPVAGASLEDLRATRSIELNFYWLTPQVKEDVIRADLWEGLKKSNRAQKIAQIGAAELKQRLQKL